jgi:hypothetical protein
VRKLNSVLLLVMVALIGGCPSPPPTLPPATPGGGFIIETGLSFNGGPAVSTAAVGVTATWQGDLPGAGGDPTQFNVVTNQLGLASASGKRAPAQWNFKWYFAPGPASACVGQSVTESVQLNDIAASDCQIYQTSNSVVSWGAFQMSPKPVYISSPPQVGTITGSGLKSTYGMPLVQYYKMDGTFVSQEQATTVASGGTSMQIPGFDISQLPVGTYAGFVSNAGPNGTWNYAGTAAVLVANGSVTIGGGERWIYSCLAPPPLAGLQTAAPAIICPKVYDSGVVSVTVNGFTATVDYGQGSSIYTIATALANTFNSASTSPVVAFPYSNVVAFQKKVSTTTYSLSATSRTDDPLDFGKQPSFTAKTSGSTM